MRTAAASQISAKPSVTVAPAITFVTVPVPPSVNALYRNVAGKGRVKTSAYKDWLGVAGWRLRAQAPAPVPGRVVIVLAIERESAVSDVDNRIKAILDLLVTHKVIKDDRYVTALAVAWAPRGTGVARVAVMPAHDLTLRLLVAADAASGGWFLSSPATEENPDHGH